MIASRSQPLRRLRQLRLRGLSFAASSLLLFHAAPAAADAPQPPPAAQLLQDSAALARWLEAAHPQLAASAARVEEARAEFEQSRLWQNPELDVGAGNLAVGRRARTDVDLGAAWTVGLSQEIELGKRGPRREAASLRHAAAREEHAAVLGTTVADARRRLAEVAWLAARQRVLDENLALAEEAADAAGSRARYGDTSGADLARLQLDALRLQSEVARNQAALEAARSSCAAGLAAPCDLGPEADELLRVAAPLPETLDPDERLRRRPDLRALELHGRAAAEDATLASRRAIPDPTFRLGYEHDRFRLSNDDPYTVGISVALPLPVFDRGGQGADAARARSRELGHLARGETDAALATVEGLARRRSALEHALSFLESEALPRSETILGASRIAFEQGEYGTTELLLARREGTELRLQLLDLSFELFEVRNDLRLTLGLDPEAGNRNETIR